MSICLDYVNKTNEVQDVIDESIDGNIMYEIIHKYELFYKFIEQEDLFSTDEMKPIYDGSQIMQILKIKPGKEIGILIEGLIENQIIHPNLSESEACEFLQRKREELAKLTINKKIKKK